MPSRRAKMYKGLFISTCLALLHFSTSLYADRVVVFGDSGAAQLIPMLQEVLTENGHPDITVAFPGWVGTSRDLSSPMGLAGISEWLDARPEANIVHLSIGGNDWLQIWAPDWAGTQREADFFAGIVGRVEIIVHHIFYVRPDAQIMWSSYDYIRPIDLGTPTEVNLVQIKMGELAAQLASTTPGLSFVNFHGLMQVTYGFDGVQHTVFDPVTPIPPGAPSLPDATLPSPRQAFKDPKHLTAGGFKVLAQAQYDQFYGPLLDGPAFHINAGHAGAWYNSDTSGQGQLIDVEPESQFMFLAWFTFTDIASNNPDQQHWYTAQGNYSGNTAELILHETLGGLFNHPQQPINNPVGTATLSFSDCEQGQMVYSIDTDGREGTIPLQRLISGSGNVCEELSGPVAATIEAVDINSGMDGAWVNEGTLGQGFLMDAYPNKEGGNFIFVAWFTYGDDTASGLRWLTAQGDFAGSMAEIDIHETTGGRFDDPLPPDTAKVGTMTIDFTDCSNAQLSYSLTADELAGDMVISRLIPGGQALCEELAGAD